MLVAVFLATVSLSAVVVAVAVFLFLLVRFTTGSSQVY
jgi:hypothetical protein